MFTELVLIAVVIYFLSLSVGNLQELDCPLTETMRYFILLLLTSAVFCYIFVMWNGVYEQLIR